MNRLTNKIADKDSFIPYLPYSLLGVKGLNEVANKLAEYENLEEKGLLLRLPCKEGDTIYSPVSEYYKGGKLIKESYIIEMVVTRFELTKGNLTIIARNGVETREFSFNSFGRVVFLAREDAELRLAELIKESD